MEISKELNLQKRISEKESPLQFYPSIKREMSRAVIDAQEKERKHLSRELHDNVNQILSSCKLFLEVAESETNNKDYFVQLAQKNIILAIEEIRNISHALNPSCLDNAGLVNSIIDLSEHINRSGKINFHIDIETFNEDFLFSPIKLAIFRIVQEQVNNILKHSRARNLRLSLHSTEAFIVLNIEDDGIGFNVSNCTRGLGLNNIVYRVECYKGRYELISSPGNGCQLKIEMPFYLPAS